jgi:hypothetical protein
MIAVEMSNSSELNNLLSRPSIKNGVPRRADYVSLSYHLPQKKKGLFWTVWVFRKLMNYFEIFLIPYG